MMTYLSGTDSEMGKLKNPLKGKGKALVQKAKKPFVKVSLAPVRASFLTLVSTNFTGLATKLNSAKKKDAKKVQAFWQKFGGDNNKLNNAIKSGLNLHNKTHPKNKISYVGSPVAVALATATPIIVAVTPLLKSIIGKEAETTPAEDVAIQSGKENFVANNTPDETSETPFYKKPIFYVPAGIVGAGLLSYGIYKAVK